MYKIILALCFIITINTVCFANVITETTISGTIAIKANIAQTTEITNLKIDIVGSAGVVAMSLTPNIALENSQIIVPQTRIDGLLDDTYKLVISGDGYITSSSQTFTLPTLTNIVFSVTDFLQIPEKPPAIIHSIGGMVVLKEDISKVSEIQNFKINIVNSVGATAMSLAANEDLENSNIIIPNTDMDGLQEGSYKLVASGDGYKSSDSQTFTLPTTEDINFIITDFLQIPEKPHIVLPTTTNFESAITIMFAQVAKDTEIYYTTDGSVPTSMSQHYVEGISISESSIIKAITVRDGVPSGVFERAYTNKNPVSVRDTGEPKTINLNIPPATSKTSSQPTVKAQAPILPQVEKFSDVSAHWAKAYIDELVSAGIINGYEDKTFRPDDLITRAEAIKLIVCAMNLQPTQAPGLPFNDNSNIPSWAAGYIEVALKKGITNGYDDNTFKAMQNVSREELSVLAIRAFGISKQGEILIDFVDKNDISNWALDYINIATGLGIITGYEDNTFKPNSKVTRAEALAIVVKSIHKLRLT